MPKTKKIIYKAQYSELTLDTNTSVTKKCLAKSFPKDYLRKYFFLSRAHREYRGAIYLNSIGLSTPKPISAKITLSPFSKTESFYSMSFLNDHKLATNYITPNNEAYLLKLIAKQFSTMIQNNICIKDFGLHNIMISNDNKIVWIDTAIRKFYTKKSLLRYMNKELRYFNKRHEKQVSKYGLYNFNQLIEKATK